MGKKDKAKDSAHIRKVREKLERHMAKADKLVNDEALNTMKRLIERQLERTKSQRIDLKSKLVTLFDENQNPAKSESKYVANLMRHLKEPQAEKQPKQLEGRVKAISDENSSR